MKACPNCGSRATKIVHMSAAAKPIECQACGHHYNEHAPKECQTCGGLPPGEASSAGDLCHCVDGPAWAVLGAVDMSGDDASREAAKRMSVRGPSPEDELHGPPMSRTVGDHYGAGWIAGRQAEITALRDKIDHREEHIRQLIAERDDAQRQCVSLQRRVSELLSALEEVAHQTSEEQAREIAEGFGYPGDGVLATEIAAALRLREAETWEQAARYVDSIACEMVDYGSKESARVLVGVVHRLRARAAQPQEETK